MRRVLTFLGLSVFILLAVGLIVLASAGGVNGFRRYKDEYHYIVRQCICLAPAIIAFFVAMKFDYHKWRELPWLTIACYVFILLLMGLVFFFPKRNGSWRWVYLGSFGLQPSEFAKLIVVIATAVFLDKAGWMVGKFWRGAFRAGVIVGIPVLLALAEPDFGAATIIAATAVVLFLVAGMPYLHIFELAGAGLCGVGTLLAFNANRMNRILSWLKSMFGGTDVAGAAAALSEKQQAAAHQVNMALVAIQRGGVTGVGYMESMQKRDYLPEAHTDFIFAIGAEEMGLVFSLVLLALFVTFFVCGIIVAARARDRLGRLIAYGMTFLLFVQALLNIGVVTKCLPTKGLALPFISYGGTNLIAAMIAVGFIFNVGRQIELPKHRPRSTISPCFSTQGV